MNLQAENNRILILGAVTLLLGLLFDFLFYYAEGLGLNFLIYIVLISLAGLALSALYGRSLNWSNKILIILSILFAGMVFIRSSELLTFFNVLGSLLLLLTVVYSYAGKKLEEYLLVDYAKVFLLPFSFLKPLYKTAGDFINTLFSGFFGENSTHKQILRGIVLAVIAVSIFGILFSSADIVFQKFISHFFTISLDPETVQQIAVVVLVTAFFAGAFGYMLR